MSRKIIFFDLDNTLWDHNMQIPASAAEAIRRLSANGHLTFICTGRARSNLRSEELMALPFDGIMAACGNHIEMHGEILHERLLSDREAEHAIRVMTQCHMPMVVEGPEYHWIDEEGFDGDDYVDYLWEVLGDSGKPLKGYEPGMRINKFSTCILPDTDMETIRRELKDELDIIEHPMDVVELIPKGTSKASGIEKLCRLLEIDHEDTYALGDSSNDLEMLEYVAHGIAMGNGMDNAKAAAEYITADIHEDGVFLAMKHYGLI